MGPRTLRWGGVDARQMQHVTAVQGNRPRGRASYPYGGLCPATRWSPWPLDKDGTEEVMAAWWLRPQRETYRRGLAAEGAPVVHPVLQHDIHVVLGRRPQQVAQLRRQMHVWLSAQHRNAGFDAGTQLREGPGDRGVRCSVLLDKCERAAGIASLNLGFRATGRHDAVPSLDISVRPVLHVGHSAAPSQLPQLAPESGRKWSALTASYVRTRTGRRPSSCTLPPVVGQRHVSEHRLQLAMVTPVA